MPSFDVVSSPDLQEIDNAINNTKREVDNRFDFKNTNSLSYIKDCIDSAWVSSGGNWVSDFESKLCEYTS